MMLEDPQLAILNIVNTRWLSMSNSAPNIGFSNWCITLWCWIWWKIHLAKNLLDELNWEFVTSMKYLADLMFILTKLINVFQKEFVSFADIKIHLDTTYDAITAQFIGFDRSTPLYGTHLRKYMHDYNILPENLPSFIKSFSEAIIDSIKSRFSQSDLYHSFRIFDPKLFPTRESKSGDYGKEDINKLSDYYGVDKVDGWWRKYSGKIINSDNVRQEWEVAKYYIKQIKGQDAAGGWKYIFNMYPDFSNEFPNISKLVKILLIILLSNAQVERIFSQHKLTKIWLRNRMNIESLNKYLMILLNGPDDFYRFDWWLLGNESTLIKLMKK